MQAHGVSLRVFYGHIDTKMLTMKPNRSENNKNKMEREKEEIEGKKICKLIVNFSNQPARQLCFQADRQAAEGSVRFG